MPDTRTVKFPTIAPVDAGEERPFWSVMIPTYNRTKYLEQTLRSVLDQDPGPGKMQITVVDNASTEPGVEALVREVGGGRVEFFRQESNIGVVGNWNTCVHRARGQWVHILHDDDLVMPGFYARYERFIEENPEIGMVFSRPILIDEESVWKNILQIPQGLKGDAVWPDAAFGLLTQHTSNFLRCPAIVIARAAYEKVGGYDPGSFYSLDWQLCLRVASSFAVGYIREPLSLYREYTGSVSYTLMRDRDLIADIQRNMRIGLSLLPPERRQEARPRMDEVLADLSRLFRAHMVEQGFPRSELRYSRYLFRFQPGPLSLALLAKSLARARMTRARPKSAS